MELKDFISDVLASIVYGVEQAQEQIKNSKAIINPRGTQGLIAIENSKPPPDLTIVEFEVSVQATTARNGGGGVAVKVAVVEVSGQGKTETTDSENSRLKFSIPVLLPPGRIFQAESA